MNDATKKPIVLAVDDDPTILNTLLSVLREICDVRPITSAAAALRYLEKFSADAVLLDCHMPETDGFGMLRLLKSNARTADIPVLFLSGVEDEETEARARREGAADFIRKPVDPKVLAEKVARYLKHSPSGCGA